MKISKKPRDLIIYTICLLIATILLAITYALANIFNPNYVEFGVFTQLFTSQNCTDLVSMEKDCLIYGVSNANYKNNPVTVSDSLKFALNSQNGQNFALPAKYSKNPNDWQCSMDKKNIVDMQTKIDPNHGQKYIYCWPK